MSTSFADKVIETRFSNIWNAGTREMSNRLAGIDWKFDNPELHRRTQLSSKQLDDMYSLTREFYATAEDPSDEIQRDQLARIFHNINPSKSVRDYKENLEDMFYTTTGYRTDVKGIGEHLKNTFNAAGSSFLAGIKTFSAYLNGMFDDDEEWTKRMEELDVDLSRYAMTYRDDIYDTNFIGDAATEAARILPSMLPTLGITGILAATSVLSGGATAGALGMALPQFVKVFGTLNTASKITGASALGARFFTSAIMEAGGTALELHKAGFDPSVVRGVSTVVGLVNGIWEGVGDSLGNSLDRLVSAPIASLGKKFGKSKVNEAVRYSLKDIFVDRGKEYLKSLATEPATEAMQELSSMLGYNVAVYLQNKAGKPLKDVVGYSVDEITDAMGETALSTFKGTLFLGAASSTLNTLGSSAFGDIRTALNLNTKVRFNGATGMAKSQNVTVMGKASDISTLKEDLTVDPIPVVNIGGRYYTYGASPEQNAIAKSSKSFYINEIPMEASLRDSVESDMSASRRTILNTITTAFKKDRLAGFTFLDGDKNKVSNINEAVSVAIQPDNGNAIVVKINDSEKIKQQDVEKTVWGETLTRSFTQEEEAEFNRIINEAESNEIEVDTAEIDDEDSIDTETNTVSEEQNSNVESEKPLQTAIENTEKAEADSRALSESISEQLESINKKNKINELASKLLDPIEEQKKEKKIAASNKNFLKALGSLNASDQEITDIANSLNELANLYKDTDVAKVEGEKQAARTAAIAMTGFAHAQGKTFKEFYDGLKMSRDNLPDSKSKALEQNTLNEHSKKAYEYLRKSNSEKEYVRKYEQLLSMASVYDVNERKFPYDRKTALPMIETFYHDKYGNSIIREDIGKIIIGRKSINASWGHGMTEEKLHSFEAVPEVIKNGLMMIEEPQYSNNEDRYIIAAPIRMFDTDYICQVIVRRTDKNSFYIHDVRMKETSLAVPQHISNLQDADTSKRFGTAERLNLIITDVYDAIKNSILNQNSNSAVGGWYQNGTIGITKDATPTTLSHEISHHFLSTLQDGDVKNKIVETYKNEYEKDGNEIGTNLQEAFAYDFEQYIYFNQTKNKEIGKVFAELKRICSRIWKFFTDKSSLSNEQIALFDSIFDAEENAELSQAVSVGVDAVYEKTSKDLNPQESFVDQVEQSIKEIKGTKENNIISEESVSKTVADMINAIRNRVPDVDTSIEKNTDESSLDAQIQDTAESIIKAEKIVDDVPENKPSNISYADMDIDVPTIAKNKSVKAPVTMDIDIAISEIKSLRGKDTVLSGDYIIQDITQIKDPKIYGAISKLSKKVKPFDWSLFFDNSNGNIYALDSLNKKLIVIPSTIDNGSIKSPDAYSIASGYGDYLTDEDYNKIFEFVDGEEYPKESFLLQNKPSYDYRIVADAFLKNLSMSEKSNNSILFQTVEKNNVDDFASYLIDSIFNGKLDKFIADFKKSGQSDIESFVRSNELILNELEGFDEGVKNNLIDSIARQIRYYSESYAPMMSMLSSALKNKKKFSKTANTIQDMVDSIVSRMNKPSRFWDNMDRYFTNTESSTEQDRKINEAYGIFKQAMQNNSKISADDFRTMLSGVITTDGELRRVEEDRKYGYRSFVTDLLDAYDISTKLNEVKSDSLVEISDSRTVRQDILKYQMGVLNVSDSFDAGIYPLMKEIAHANIDNTSLRNLYDGYIDSRLAETVAGEFARNYDELKEKISTLTDKKKELSELKEKYRTAIRTIEDIQKENKRYTDITNKEFIKNSKKIAALSDELKKMKEQADRITAESIKLNEELELIRKERDNLNTEKIRRLRNNMIDNTIATSLKKGDARWHKILSGVMKYVSYKKNVGNLLKSDTFTTIWPTHVKYLNSLLQALHRAGIVGRNENGNIVQLKRINDLDEKQLSSFLTDINNITENVRSDIDKRNSDHESERKEFERGIVDDLRRFKSNFNDDEWNSFITEYRKTFAYGSKEEKAGRRKSKLPTVEFIQMANSMESFSPALYAYFFGGEINGKIVEHNLNSATNAEQIKSTERINRFYEVGADAFNMDKKTFKNDFNRLMLGREFNMSSVDFESFRSSKEGKSILSDDRFEALNTYIENVEESLETARKKYDNRMEALEQMDFPSKKEYEFEKLLIEAELSSAEAAYDRKINGIDSTLSYTMDDVMGIYIYSQQTDGLRGLIATDDFSMNNGLSISQILYVLDEFENNDEYAPYRKLADFMIKDMSSRFFDISDVYYRTTGKILNQISNYFIIRRDIERDTAELNPTWGNEMFTLDANPTSRSTKERTSSREPLMLNVASSYAASIKESEHYIAFAELMRDYAKLFDKRSDFSAAFNALSKEYGFKGKEILDSYFRQLRIISRGTAVNTEAVNATSQIVRTLRNNFSRAVLFGSVTSLLNVFVSLPVSATEAGGANLMKTFFKYLGNKSDIDNIVYEKSPQMKNRARLEFDELTRNRAYGKVTESMKKVLGDNAYKLTDTWRRFVNKWFDIMQKLDNRVANMSWYAIYTKLVEEYDGDITPEIDAMLSDQATQKTLNIMPSQNAKDNALIFSSPDNAVKQMLLFTSQLNKQFNILWSGVKDVTGHKGLANFNEWQWRNISVLMENFAVLALATALAAVVSGEALPEDDDDEWWKAMLRGTGVESLSMIPAIGNTLRDVATGNVYSDTGIAGAVVNLTKVLFKDENDRTDHQLGNAIMRTGMMAGQVLGLPYNIGYKPYQWIKNGMELEDLGYIINSNWGEFFEEAI